MAEKIKRWFTKLRYNWSHERCYTNMEYAGHAAMGCCGGLVGGDKSTSYLQYTCIGCPHHVDIATAAMDRWKKSQEKEYTLEDHLDAAADALEALLAEVERLNSEMQLENTQPESDGKCREDDGCPTENAVLRREWRKLTEQLASVTAERDSLIKDFTNYAKGGTTDPSPYCANKAECIADDGWCILERCDFRPNACGHGKEQNDD